jgi:hypothetical protein
MTPCHVNQRIARCNVCETAVVKKMRGAIRIAGCEGRAIGRKRKFIFLRLLVQV